MQSKQVIEQFLHLHQEFHESHSKAVAQKLVAFMLNSDHQMVARRCATHNPHPKIHQSFEQDWEATIVSLNSWVAGKVDFSVPSSFLDDIKTWITEDFE